MNEKFKNNVIDCPKTKGNLFKGLKRKMKLFTIKNENFIMHVTKLLQVHFKKLNMIFNIIY